MQELSGTQGVFYPSTSARTFRIAGQLREIDFDFAGLSRQMDTHELQDCKTARVCL